jgi:hypothetical protein
MMHRLAAAALVATLCLACESRGASTAPPDTAGDRTGATLESQTCASVGAPGCPESIDVEQCRKVAIRHEYEMIEAGKMDRPALSECHRDALYLTLDEACGRGNEASCEWAAAARRTTATADAPTSPAP